MYLKLVSDTERGIQVMGVQEQGAWKIVWPKSDKVTRECRRLHNEQLYGFTLRQILFV